MNLVHLDEIDEKDARKARTDFLRLVATCVQNDTDAVLVTLEYDENDRPEYLLAQTHSMDPHHVAGLLDMGKHLILAAGVDDDES